MEGKVGGGEGGEERERRKNNRVRKENFMRP